MKDNKVFIQHIRDEINYLIKESKNLTYESFIKNETLKRAFTRSLEIIGEATKNISTDFRERYPGIGWKELTGLRDKLIHHYFGVWNRVWDVIENLIPKLNGLIKKILEEANDNNDNNKR